MTTVSRARRDRAATWDAPTRAARTPIGRTADLLTIFGVFLAPSYGLGFGGRLGIAYADIVLGLAGLARVLQLLIVGVSVDRLRRHAFLGAALVVFALAGLASGVANGSPFSTVFVFTVISTLGTLFLVATYGGPTLQIAQALTLGYGLLAFSVFVNPSNRGRAIGFSIHPNALGHSCVMGIAIAGWMWDNASSRRERWLWAAIAGGCLVAVLLSGSRGGAIAVVVAGFTYLCLRGNLRIVAAAVAGVWVLGMLLAVGVLQLPEGNAFDRQVVEASTDTGSNAARSELLQEDLDNIADDPVFGLGFDHIVSVHVVYFQGWVGGGAICALVLITLGIAMLAFPLWTRRSDLALTCGMMAVAVMWLFTNILTARDQWIFLTLAFLAAPWVSSRARRGRDQPAGTGSR